MSAGVCTAAEIAEKRRIALEKLNAKKAKLQTNIGGQATTTNNNNNNSFKPESSHRSVLASTNSNTSITQVQPSNSGHSSTLESESRASFLKALKNARNPVHPYRRPRSPAAEQTAATKKPIPADVGVQPIFGTTISCQVCAISLTRFVVKLSGFHGKLIDVFKTIPSKTYDQKSRNWSFSFKDYELLQQKVAPLKSQVCMAVIPKSVLQLLKKSTETIENYSLDTLEPTLLDQLLPFQMDGVRFAIAQKGRIMICDEMGLGKTYQALAIADYYRANWPLLICTTASNRDSFYNHVRTLLPSVPISSVQVLANRQQYIGDCKILVTSYNMMERNADKLMERKFGFIIFDESHNLKNNKAKCTVVADRLSKAAIHVVMLSGTPALSRPLELFSQIQMIDARFMSFMEFTSRYCNGKQTHFGWDASGQSNLEELNVVLKLRFMIRRTKSEVLPQMADKFRETVVLDSALVWPNADTKAALNELSNDFYKKKGREREEILLKFYARTSEVKANAVCAYVETLVKDRKKFIIFAHHRVMLDAIDERLNQLRVGHVRIDGSTRNDLREEYVKAFQIKSSCQVAVLSLRACNSGITLTAAELVVFAELDWNPSTLAQAESRAHRIGQDKPVTCCYLMANNTADDLIWNILKGKQDVLNKAGLFCENLQEATHKSASKSDNFSFDEKATEEKASSETKNESSWDIFGDSVMQEIMEVEKLMADNIDDKEFESVDEFLNDGSDDIFKDLNY